MADVEALVGSQVVAMSGRTLLGLTLLLSWALLGVTIAALMARRGHDFGPLAALGVLLGPFLGGPGRSSPFSPEREIRPVVMARGAELDGDIDVLIAVLDDPGRVADAVSFIGSAGRDLGRVVLAAIVTFETANDDNPIARASRKAAAAKLTEAAGLLPGLDPGMVLLPGRAGPALRDYSADNGIDMVVTVGEPARQAAVQRQGADWECTIVVTTARPADRLVGEQ